jgi:adenylate cyclase
MLTAARPLLRTKTHLHILPDGIEGVVSDDQSILDAALAVGVAHCHECGGQAHCTTCRVHVVDGLEHCEPRNEREEAIAKRLKLPPEIRLACQTRISGDVTVRRLVLDDFDVELTSSTHTIPNYGIGREQRLAILFLDIRGFTGFAEQLLPYDVIHFLRRFFVRMSTIVKQHGGVVDNYMGDGMLALFGVDDAPAEAARAVKAGIDMLAEAERMRPYERSVGGRELEIGIGVHIGEVVVGTLGDLDRPRTTVVGDAVNMASRVETANKPAGTHFLISEEVYRELGEGVEVGRSFELSLHGKTGTYVLYEVLRAA